MDFSVMHKKLDYADNSALSGTRAAWGCRASQEEVS